MTRRSTLYRIGRFFLRTHLLIWHGLTAVDAENIPESGGAIIACNHISHLDPPSVGSAISRDIRFVAKEELFHQFFLSWYFPLIGIIPLKRGGGGKMMLDNAAEAIKEGDIVALFPEGTRSKTGLPGRPRTGMIILAAMSGAPIIPARISGSYDCMPPKRILPLPGKIQVAFGKPIQWKPGELDVGNRDQMIDEARKVMDIILELPGWYPKKARIKPDKSELAETSTSSENS